MYIYVPGFLLLPTAVFSMEPKRVRLDWRIINGLNAECSIL